MKLRKDPPSNSYLAIAALMCASSAIWLVTGRFENELARNIAIVTVVVGAVVIAFFVGAKLAKKEK